MVYQHVCSLGAECMTLEFLTIYLLSYRQCMSPFEMGKENSKVSWTKNNCFQYIYVTKT